MSRIKLSFVQAMLGSGFPSTVQLKIAVSLSIFPVLTGCLVNPGASGRKKYKTTNQDRISKRNVQSYFLVKKKSVRVDLVDGANFIVTLDRFLNSLARSRFLLTFSFSFSSIWVTKYSRICMKSSTNFPSLLFS